MLQGESILCPYCGETIEVLIDESAGEQQYIEDCSVCCRPIEIAVSFDEESGVLVSCHAENEAWRESVVGYQKLRCEGRDDIRTIITDRLERSRNTDPATLSYDPESLRRYNRKSDSLIEIVDADTARHRSTWMVVMKTNVDIHISAIGRYEDELVNRDGEWQLLRRVRIE